MFFILVILFFLKYSSVNLLTCTSHRQNLALSISGCDFDLDITDPIPDNKILLTSTSKCATRDPNMQVAGMHVSGGACYGEISINYNTKRMFVKLIHVLGIEALRDPYDDMIGFMTGIKSVVQYKIIGNLENDEVTMITRVQCKTSDDCALKKLRLLLSNLTIIDTRLKVFGKIIELLNEPPSSPLTCETLNSGQEDECVGSNNRCEFSIYKDKLSQKGCVAAPTNKPYDIEYRFNVIEEIETPGSVNSVKAHKLNYLCTTNLCNSGTTVQQVNELLNSFALTSSNTQGSNTQGSATHSAALNKPTSKSSSQAKSDGLSFIISHYYRWLIIFSIIIQILWN